DLLVAVPSVEEAKQRCIGPIEELGYAYIPAYASWLPGELFFRKGPPGPWTHHLHLMELSNPRWKTLLVFRDIFAHTRKQSGRTAESSEPLLLPQKTTSRPIETARLPSLKRQQPKRAHGASASSDGGAA